MTWIAIGTPRFTDIATFDEVTATVGQPDGLEARWVGRVGDELLLVGVEVGAHVGDAAALGADGADDRGDLGLGEAARHRHRRHPQHLRGHLPGGHAHALHRAPELLEQVLGRVLVGHAAIFARRRHPCWREPAARTALVLCGIGEPGFATGGAVSSVLLVGLLRAAAAPLRDGGR